ncbi:MAG: acyl-CoA dehydrogenase family protein [Nitrososphaerales archaeon]
MGSLRMDLISMDMNAKRQEFVQFYKKLKEFLETEVDPAIIDATGEYPQHVMEGLKRLGCFGMKIPVKYGGLGLSQIEYGHVMRLLGSYDANITALLSAHQSIGAPQPLILFGTEEQKSKYLPRLAAGAISAFALTEVAVGSDPARISTTVSRIGNGDYLLNGRKLWCTNGTIAEILIVIAKHADSGKLSAFIVESNYPGIIVEHRCRFMGLRAIGNAVISFNNVRIPKSNLIGEEGHGLKIALTTLNAGRLSLPAAAVGAAKKCLEFTRTWANERIQWGRPIGRHEAITHKIGKMAACVFAMDAVSELSDYMAMKPGVDIRLEAAAAKEFNTVIGWNIIDDTMQIRGGRGYENEASLRARGEKPYPVERMMRDFRINLIFEGSSEIMHLFIAREAMDEHIKTINDIVKSDATIWQKSKKLIKMMSRYSIWYLKCLFSLNIWPKYHKYGRLGCHLRFIDRSSKLLARMIFNKMIMYRYKLQYKQAIVFRFVDIALYLYAMSAVINKSYTMRSRGVIGWHQSEQLADVFCAHAKRYIMQKFRDLSCDDNVYNMLANDVLDNKMLWVESNNV